MFTQVRSANRRVSPVENHKHKAVMKAVYVVLEPQYQNALTQAANSLNSQNGPIGIELNGLVEKKLYSGVKYLDPIEITHDITNKLKNQTFPKTPKTFQKEDHEL